MATGCTGDIRTSLTRVAQDFVFKMCRGGVRKAVAEFHFEDVELKCVGEFAYLGDMLNDKGRVKQAVTARVRAAWMKFREYGVREGHL